MSSPPWFRFYSETLRDRKIERVCRATEQPKVVIVGVWATLLALANDSPVRGSLLLTKDIPLTVSDIVAETGLSDEAVEVILSEFKRLNMLTVNNEVLCICNWQKYKAPIGRSAWGKLRAWVMARDNNQCRYCGSRAEHIDHVIPRSRNGTDDTSNLVAACAACNLRKSARTPKEAEMILWPHTTG